MLGQLLNPEILVSLAALAALEIVLGIDNIVFIAIMVQRLPEATRKVAYRLGLGAALSTRLLLLFTLKWIVGLTTPLFTILRQEISGRDMVLLLGGAFLIFKSSTEIFHKVESQDEEVRSEDRPKPASFTGVIVQIMIIDIVFSLDSVITAVGIAQQLWVMATAMVLAVLVMMLFAQAVGDFVTRHPSMQILALSFLLLIGVLLVAEGFDQHVSKGYIYFAMGFSILVELANMRRRAKAKAEGRVAPSVRGS
ncbi:MAG: TerC family protein [Myxococcales bacterium]|nr:TerC family protein [Myxococcales bacterium]